MAGNDKSGAGIPFRLSENALIEKMEQFRQEYGDGSQGMVTWERFCTFLGYSVEEVKECYQKGKGEKNAYRGRADLIERFYTEVTSMMFTTCTGQASLAGKLAGRDLLRDPEEKSNEKTFGIRWACGSERAEKARF